MSSVPSQPLKVGIAGYGVIGARRHQYIDAHGRFKVVAICDKREARRNAAHPSIASYATHDELLAHGIDVLFVCLPNDLAPQVTIAGLEAGLHVFCEKPPGRTVADIRAVMEAERRHPGLKLKYGFNHRYHDSVRDALRLVSSGELGTVINLRGVYGKSAFIPWPRELSEAAWRTSRDIAGGGILLDQGIHLVDLMRLFAGEFSEVKSFVSNSFWRLDVEDNAYALLRSPSGVVAMLHSTATQWRHRFSLEISLTKGALILGGILSGTKSYGQETLTVVYREEDDEGNPREHTTTYVRDNSWRDEIADFAINIIEDTPVGTGGSKDALGTMNVVYQVYCADPEWRVRYGLSLD